MGERERGGVVKVVIILSLLFCVSPLWAQTPRPLAQQLKQAMAMDLDGPAYRTKARSERIQSLLQDDERAVKQALGKGLSQDGEGWIPCSKAQGALREAMATTQTVVGIEVLVRAAFALQVQCSGSTDLETLKEGFGSSLEGALRASAAALPGGLSNTYTLTSKLTPGELVSGFLGAASQSDEMKCSASALYRERRRGSDYAAAEGLALKECTPTLPPGPTA